MTSVGPRRLKRVQRMAEQHLSGGVSYSPGITVAGVMGVNGEEAPRVFQLIQNYPNPFNPSTFIKFTVEKPEHAVMKVYNVLGQEVASLFEGMAEPGHYFQFNFDATALGSGIYIYRIVTDSHSAVRKMLMIK